MPWHFTKGDKRLRSTEHVTYWKSSLKAHLLLHPPDTSGIRKVR